MSGRAVSTALLTTSASSTRRTAQLHLVAVDAGDVEQVVDQPDHVAELPLHHVPGLGDGVGVAGREPHHLQAVAQRGQRVAQLVGQQREELVLAAVRLPERLLGPLPLGDVAGDLRRPDDAAVAVADRGDRQGDVEPAAVLGHADRLEVLDPLPAAEPRQDRALLVDAAPAG